METQLKHYEFINVRTGNVIAYVSLPADMVQAERLATLERKKVELATINQLNFELIYWQDHERCIK